MHPIAPFDVKMCVVILHQDSAVAAAEMASSLRNWIGDNCLVIQTTVLDVAKDVVGKIPIEFKTHIALAAGKDALPFLGGLTGFRLRGLLADGTVNDGIVCFGPGVAPGYDDVMYHLVQLLRTDNTDIEKVWLNVKNKGEGNANFQHVKHLLERARVYFKVVEDSGVPEDKVIVTVGSKKSVTNPTPLALAKLLHFSPSDDLEPSANYDVVVVGAGPAGMSAAVCTGGMLGLKTLLLESEAAGGLQSTSINQVENYLGFPGGVGPLDLVQRGLNQVINLKNVDFRPGLIATQLDQSVIQASTEVRQFKVSWKDDWRPEWEQVRVRTDESGQEEGSATTGSVTAGIAVIATGRKPRRVIDKSKYPTGAENEEKFAGHGLYYHALAPDAENVKGLKIAIVGAGDTAGRAIIMFANAGAKVTMIVRDEFGFIKETADKIKKLIADKMVILKQPFEVVDFVSNQQGALKEAKIKKKLKVGESELELVEVEVDRAYALIGEEADTQWLTVGSVKPSLDNRGFVITEVSHEEDDPKNDIPLPMQTSVAGLFAIGDVRSPGLVQRVAQAAGQGATAAVSIDLYLRKTNKQVLVDETSPAFTFYKQSYDDKPSSL